MMSEVKLEAAGGKCVKIDATEEGVRVQLMSDMKDNAAVVKKWCVLADEATWIVKPPNWFERRIGRLYSDKIDKAVRKAELRAEAYWRKNGKDVDKHNRAQRMKVAAQMEIERNFGK